MTADLTAWLLARVTEDEAVARAAAGREWWIADSVNGFANIHDAATGKWVALEVRDHHATHIARHDPARVLAECAAYRAVVELAAEVFKGDGPIREGSNLEGQAWAYERTLRALATIWADHPTYYAEWRLT